MKKAIPVNDLARPVSITYAVLLIVVNTLFAVVLFFNHTEDLVEPYEQWSPALLSLIISVIWFSLAWFIYKRHLWAKNVIVAFLVVSVGYTAFGVMNDPAQILPVEFLQTTSDVIVLMFLSSPSALAWLNIKGVKTT